MHYFSRIFDKRLLASALVVLSAQEHKHQKESEKENLATIRRCSQIIEQKMTEIGCPGLVIGVSVNGQNTWTQGFGYSDLENDTPCKPDTVMRIASISKSLTMAAVAKLIENKKLDIDKPVQDYVPEFPVKLFQGKEVNMTTRMLLSHTSGIRHYERKENDDDIKESKSEFANLEHHSMKRYGSVIESLDMFKNDELFFKSGESYLYTTHGWTLVSAVVERASGENFTTHMNKMFSKLGMQTTKPESATDLVYNRSRYYIRNENGRIENVPYVDLSYKWAGGGFISSVPDLLKFGNVMLYSYQYSGSDLPGFLKRDTVHMIWTPVTETKKTGKHYGMGWEIDSEINEIGCGMTKDFEVSHTGGAVGASSVLYICPSKKATSENPPYGIVVAIITNLQGVGLTEIARTVANEFKQQFSNQ